VLAAARLIEQGAAPTTTRVPPLSRPIQEQKVAKKLSVKMRIALTRIANGDDDRIPWPTFSALCRRGLAGFSVVAATDKETRVTYRLTVAGKMAMSTGILAPEEG
jgi:hypothetical protein